MARKKHQVTPEDLDRPISPAEQGTEGTYQAALRPQSFEEYVGQREVLENLRVSVAAAKKGGWCLDHFLFAGPPGLGKTTLAYVIANELGARLHVTSAPAMEHRGQLGSMVAQLAEGDVLFIDEIHRLHPVVEENLYSVMEDFKLDAFVGDGPHAKAFSLQVPRFTLLGATTRMGSLSAPFLDRFGFHWQLRYYDQDDMTTIVERSARLLEVKMVKDGASEIARRARGTPRIANRLLRRVRDFAEVEGTGVVDKAIAASALERLQVDRCGLDSLDRAYLNVVVQRFDGGPVGVDAIAASLSEERGTLEDVVEPFLLQAGFIARTPRGRIATHATYDHLGVPKPKRKAGAPTGAQGRLF